MVNPYAYDPATVIGWSIAINGLGGSDTGLGSSWNYGDYSGEYNIPYDSSLDNICLCDNDNGFVNNTEIQDFSCYNCNDIDPDCGLCYYDKDCKDWKCSMCNSDFNMISHDKFSCVPKIVGCSIPLEDQPEELCEVEGVWVCKDCLDGYYPTFEGGCSSCMEAFDQLCEECPTAD